MSQDGSNASADLSQISGEDDLPVNYDYEESAWRFDLADLIPRPVVYGATLLLGLVCNLVIVYTVARLPRMRSISNLFLASLASAHLLIVLLCVSVKFGQLFSYTWTLGELGCKLLLYTQHVSMICSVLNLTFLNIES
ncbi:gastrin-releasing peptide receptor [Rhipicephalus sanguineus]|uniref:G-protein coupled receptors family 1 profile domain-containing protein n=1 Tax=Rhipicephalus sanguineus TaxID=34632 RepID=A0A9D4SNP9_RHISA|nr:gastrin-releasing peptide receptor [Rhipicephalus sanguineus]KAH7936092.1 hypothetical protein HPB52_018004 [Rhipicephalus sanguineus]